MPTVALENVSKAFAPNAVALRDITLGIADGELLVLVGPSGCGKTTLLRLIAGLEQPTAGTIRIGNREVNDVPASQRGVGMVFQRPALYPQRTVRDNLGFSLQLQRRWWRTDSLSRVSSRERVNATAVMLGLELVLDRYPRHLSGGQQQRVALGRVLVRQPGVILLDEPLSNLDAGLRYELRRELHVLQQQLHATMICVTHDPLEALSLGDRIAVLDNGRLQQVDRAEVLLTRPANRFVAGFAGWPPMNFLDGEIQVLDAKPFLATCLGRLPLAAHLISKMDSLVNRPVTLGIRPENVQLRDDNIPGTWPMQIRFVEPIGHGRLLSLTGEGKEMTAWLQKDCQNTTPLDTMVARKNVMVQIQLENALIFDRASGASLAVFGTG